MNQAPVIFTGSFIEVVDRLQRDIAADWIRQYHSRIYADGVERVDWWLPGPEDDDFVPEGL